MFVLFDVSFSFIKTFLKVILDKMKEFIIRTNLITCDITKIPNFVLIEK